MSSVTQITTCRLCGSDRLRSELTLESSPICDAYSKTPTEQKRYELGLLRCLNCDFVQLSTVVDPEILYSNYIYLTSSSTGLDSHFSGYAKSVVEKLDLGSGSLVVDVGSNDGTLLQCFKEYGCSVVGIEPASHIAANANKNGIPTIAQYFNDSTVHNLLSEYGPVDLITVNNLFANVHDLDRFVAAACGALSDTGVLIIESSYLIDMMQNMVFDFIYHEHLSYFSIKPLIKFFGKYGLSLLDVEPVATKGGSLRYYWSRGKSEWEHSEQTIRIVDQEPEGIALDELFSQFREKIDDARSRLHEILEAFPQAKIAGYGASATSATLITHFGLDNRLDYLVDDNPSKISLFCPVNNLPVYESGLLEEDQPEIIVVLAWRYFREIVERHPGFKGKWIQPLPRPLEFN
jgi:SAM-dependent methyltransferase